MAQLITYLTFNGNAKEAMEFYKSCLGGELKLQTVGDSPMAAQMPDKKDNIMHSELKAGEMTLMGSDLMMPGYNLITGSNFTLVVTGTPEEIKEYFAKFSEGSTITHPLKEEFFGLYGDLTDKFGIHWGFQADLPKAA